MPQFSVQKTNTNLMEHEIVYHFGCLVISYYNIFYKCLSIWQNFSLKMCIFNTPTTFLLYHNMKLAMSKNGPEKFNVHNPMIAFATQ